MIIMIKFEFTEWTMIQPTSPFPLHPGWYWLVHPPRLLVKSSALRDRDEALYDTAGPEMLKASVSAA